MGGGELIDTGYHPTYRMVFLANSKAAEVSAVLGTYRLPLNREDTANLLIKFESGVTGRIFSSWGVQTPGGRPTLFNIMGEAGQLWGELDRLFFQPVGFNTAASVEFPGWGLCPHLCGRDRAFLQRYRGRLRAVAFGG